MVAQSPKRDLATGEGSREQVSAGASLSELLGGLRMEAACRLRRGG